MSDSKVLVKETKKNLLEAHDYDEKIRHLTLRKRMQWFIDNKPNMSQNEKWDAFNDMYQDHDVDYSTLIKRVNALIRSNKSKRSE